MAAKVKEEKIVSPAEQALAYFKANKDDHYNFEPTIDYKVPSSSMKFNIEIGGGISPGALRFVGVTAGGKTSCVLDFMKNFLEGGENRFGYLAKAEGRLSQNMINRSGIKFVKNPEEWVAGTCLIHESNVYEHVFGFMGDHIRNNPTGAKYFFVIDSMDMMAKKDDLAKPLTEAGQVAGGALLTSVFLKKTSVALAKRGHIAAFLSQVRDEIKINPYAGGGSTPRQGKSSGGHALEHAPDWVFEFLPRFQDDIIRVGDKNSQILGHFCKIKIVKSDNETSGIEVRYPIKYKRTDGNSVWKEKEVLDILQEWEMLTRAGAWYSLSPTILEELKPIDPEIPEKFQGIDPVDKYLQSNPKIVAYLAEKFSKLVS